MNKILQINSFNNGSTGTIMKHIDNFVKQNEMISYLSYPKSRTNLKNYKNKDILIGNQISRNIHLILGFFSSFNEFFSFFSTLFFLIKIVKINPSLIQLHNLHGSYINFPLLSFFLRKYNKPVVWTLHDCWSFTGGTPHFTDMKIKNDELIYYSTTNQEYPKTLFNNQYILYLLKKQLILKIPNLTIVTPSQWLNSIASTTFLKKNNIVTINNGIDLEKYQLTKNNLRKKYEIENKIVILGVASSWSSRKGLDIFIDLSYKLSNEYKIILVGIDSNQKLNIPKTIITVEKLNSEVELSEYYSMADLFLNPSFYETMGLVTIESLACGTPVVVSNKTALPEFVDSSCGIIVKENTMEEYYKVIIEKKWLEISEESCINWAKRYSLDLKFKEYIHLYENILLNKCENNG